MKNGICPQCHSAEVYRQKDNYSGRELISLKGTMFGAPIVPHKYICAACGLIQYYLPNERDRQFVRDHWEKVAER